ncbi:MAG: S8 family serine peptidase [Dermatophilaceae bacterium]
MPTEVDNTVSVSCVGPTAVKSYYSNYGRNVIDVTAPCGDFRVPSATPSRNGRILSTVTNGGWGWKQGTSMAGPPVPGSSRSSVAPTLACRPSRRSTSSNVRPTNSRARRSTTPTARCQRRHLRGQEDRLRLLRCRPLDGSEPATRRV